MADETTTPDGLSRTVFLITIVGAVAFVAAAVFFVI